MQHITDELLSDLSIRDHISYGNVLNHLCDDWNYPREILGNILIANGGSYDESTAYIEHMDGEMVEHPSECWDSWCIRNDIEHEIDNNPYLSY